MSDRRRVRRADNPRVGHGRGDRSLGKRSLSTGGIPEGGAVPGGAKPQAPGKDKLSRGFNRLEKAMADAPVESKQSAKADMYFDAGRMAIQDRSKSPCHVC